MTRVRRRAHGISFDVDARALAGRRRLQQPRAGGHQPARQRRQVEPRRTAPCAVRLTDGVLTVDDEGSGIDEADRPHVFERFYRSEESRAMPGSGLGLAIVRQVVDRHGGRIEVSELARRRGAVLAVVAGRGGSGVPGYPVTALLTGTDLYLEARNSGARSVEDPQQPLGLPLRLGPLLRDVGLHRDAAAGAERPARRCRRSSASG